MHSNRPMRRRRAPAWLLGVGLACLLSAAGRPAHAHDEGLADVAKRLAAPAANPVVRIAAKIEVSMGPMGTQDMSIDTFGVIVDPSGLIAVSRTALNPMGEESSTVEAGPGMEIELSPELVSTSVVLADGTRLAAAVVFTDPVRDVSFLRTREPVIAKLGVATFETEAPTLPGLLAEVLVVGRTGTSTGGTSSVELKHVSAVLETPWDTVMIDARGGNAVFDKTGRFLGLVVHVPSEESEDKNQMGMMMGGNGAPGGTTVVLSAAQLKPLVAQAKKAKMPEVKERKPQQPAGGMIGGPDDKLIKPGTAAPGFKLIDDKGKPHDLADYKGKYVLLDWWGKW